VSTSSRAGETRRQQPVRELWRITYPLVVTNFAQITVTIVDTALLARFSTSALAAVALAAPVYLVAIMIVRGWATAAQIVISRRFGAHDHDAVAGVTAAGLAAAVLTGMGVAGLLFLFGPTILLLLSGDLALADPGADYLRILAAAVPFAAATFVLQGAYAGLGATRVAMVMMLLVNAVNLLFGLVFISLTSRNQPTSSCSANISKPNTGIGLDAECERNTMTSPPPMAPTSASRGSAVSSALVSSAVSPTLSARARRSVIAVAAVSSVPKMRQYSATSE
jgi:hypothetical protein